MFKNYSFVSVVFVSALAIQISVTFTTQFQSEMGRIFKNIRDYQFYLTNTFSGMIIVTAWNIYSYICVRSLYMTAKEERVLHNEGNVQ